MTPPTLDRQRLLDLAGKALLGVMALLVLVILLPQVLGGVHSYVVLSGSMQPALQPGGLVLVEETSAEEISSGDIITYERNADDEIRHMTHRVVDVVQREDGTYFRTKGDANEDADGSLVPADAVVGVVAVHIPYLGYFVSFAGTRTGIVTLVLGPAALLIVSELWTLASMFRDTPVDDSTEESVSADGENAGGD